MAVSQGTTHADSAPLTTITR